MFTVATVLNALELGFIYALVAMALFLSFRVLNIADMTTDMEVLRQALTCAKKLLAQNALELPEYKGLRGEIRRLFAKTGGEGVVL